MVRNQDIRSEIKAARLYVAEIAEKLNVSESSFYRLLRQQLTPTQKEKIRNAINELKKQKYLEFYSISGG